MAKIDTEKLKHELEERLQSLQQREEHVEAELSRPHNPDWEDDAIESEGDEVLVKVDESLIEEIRLIKLALHRIEAGHYGECVSCGKKITQSRLKALPEATSCIKCA